jgi:hypothetical protein
MRIFGLRGNAPFPDFPPSTLATLSHNGSSDQDTARTVHSQTGGGSTAPPM